MPISQHADDHGIEPGIGHEGRLDLLQEQERDQSGEDENMIIRNR